MFFLVVAFSLLVLVLVTLLLHFLAKGARYQVAIQTWLVWFFSELVILMLVPNMNLSMFGRREMEGVGYMMGFVLQPVKVMLYIVHGQGFDFLILLLVPLLPALLAQRAEFGKHVGKPPKV